MEEKIVNVPYIVHEADMARQERTIKRLWILCILLIVLLVGSNGAWIWYESQFVDEVTTITQEGEADGNGTVLLNNGGDLNYGESETDSDE